MLNHTYTSVKNAKVVDCGKKEKIPSQPFPLLRDNFLGEYRTELDKKKVLANLGIATELSLVWENIQGDIGKSQALMNELDSRTKYKSILDPKIDTVVKGIQYLETIIGGEEDAEAVQNERLTALETSSKELLTSLQNLDKYIKETIDVDVDTLQNSLSEISKKVENITGLIQVSTKENNALTLIPGEETPGLYVPDLSKEVTAATENIGKLQGGIDSINKSLEDFVTKDDLGGGDFDFVNQDTFTNYTSKTDSKISDIESELDKTVKTGEDGYVDTLYVNTISKNNDNGNIIITDSFQVDSDIPLDIRFVREDLEELYNLPVKVCYPGMGVIINSLSALYILRKPAEGVQFNQDYIKNPNNWKCPEDLVTVALTRQDYENLKPEEINPYVFYYVYEDEITRTTEPKREEYSTEEDFQREWQKWVDSLKTLSQEYMSASWGVGIENKLGKKANSSDISILYSEIKNIKGNGNNPSLESLNNSVQELQTKDDQFKERVDEILIKYEDIEQGRLVDVEKEVSKVKENLDNYVTKEYIQDSDNNFIFVKNQDYKTDKEALKESLATQIETKEVVTDSIVLGNKKLEPEERLNYNESPLAYLNDIPEIEILSQAEYDSKKPEEIIQGRYYYTFDGEIRLITSEDLAKESSRLQKQINVLFQGGTAEDVENTLEAIFLPIETWNTFQTEYQKLSTLVYDLEQRLIKVEPLKVKIDSNTIYVSGDQERCYQEGDTIYIKSDLITF